MTHFSYFVIVTLIDVSAMHDISVNSVSGVQEICMFPESSLDASAVSSSAHCLTSGAFVILM